MLEQREPVAQWLARPTPRREVRGSLSLSLSLKEINCKHFEDVSKHHLTFITKHKLMGNENIHSRHIENEVTS
jgi:hypothetical protein